MERLLDYFKPNHYDIILKINKHTGKAQGSVEIYGVPKQGTIKLDAKDLTIDRVVLNDEIVKFTQNKDILEVPYFPTKEEIKDSKDELPEICIGVQYHFDLNKNMQGAYLSSYQYEGKEELLVSTQFESHYARECFPCLDEPEAKATFSLSIQIPDSDDTVISNMPLENVVDITTGEEGRDTTDEKTKKVNSTTKPVEKLYTFEKTPKMSTYLLAFCIGRFQKKSTKTVSGVEVTTYCTLNHPISNVNYANEIAKQSLEFYDHLFGVKYPLKKLDQIAIPDFEAGAMENWGLVTYRESCLLVDKNTSLTHKQYVATVIAHELSHQWFGNLVTMKWWNNLWLNESFASIMEYIAVDAIHPDYNIWREFYTGECRIALSRDALPGVQAVQQDVSDPAEISTLFDGAIVYAKGSRLMLMLIRLMGNKAFFAGIKDYFEKHKYSNTTGDDLWAALQPHAKFDVKEFMDAWISQPGYPVFTDEVQQRFMLTGETDDTKWPLPEIKDDMSGHYLINLSGDEFEQSLNSFGHLSLEQRLRIILDRALLAKTSLVSSASLFDVLPKFKDEKSYAIWGVLLSIISDLKIFFPYEDKDRPIFQKYFYNLIETNLNRIGVLPKEKNTEEDIKLRAILLGIAYYADHRPTLEKLAEVYDDDLAKIDPEIRGDVLLAKLEVSNEKIFDKYLELYQTVTDPETKMDILFALTDAEKHTNELVKLLEQPKIVKPQDHGTLFAYLIRNHFTHKETAEWIYGHWSYVEDLVGEKSVDTYPRYFASSIRTEEESERFLDFFKPLAERNPSIKRAVDLAEVEIRSRLKLLDMDNKDVHEKLKKAKI